jgi:uncharacterized protein (TIGR04222 family)
LIKEVHMMVPGLTTMTGSGFLWLYLLMLGASFALSKIMTMLLRPAGRTQSVTDVDQLALLNGGQARLAESAVARLMAGGAVSLSGVDKFRIERGRDAASTVEASILRLSGLSTWRDIESAIENPRDIIEHKMVRQELLASDDQLQKLRWAATLPFLLLLMLGLIRLMIGIERSAPVGLLTLLLVLTLGIALLRWFKVDRRTEAGLAAVKAAKASASRLRTAPLPDEMGTAVALFGTVVLVGSMFDGLYKFRTASGGDGGGFFDGGSSDGGSGCGGGGCGGCGG